MPPINNAALSVGIIAVTVVVAAGIAIYESPELRRMAEELRRRIAIALHSLGDSISPQDRENLFNRPEDAEGFLRSRGIDVREDLGVDADDETRRRQREELMYWNAIAESKREQESHGNKQEVGRPRASTRGSSFDDFLKQDESGETGTYVFNSGADVRNSGAGLRHRGDGSRGLNYSVYTNPFADENGIDEHLSFENSLMEPEKDEIEDIYSVSDGGRQQPVAAPMVAVLSSPPEASPVLVDLTESAVKDETMSDLEVTSRPIPAPSEPSTTTTASERELGLDEFMTAGQEGRDQNDAYSSIQAWAQGSNPSFYSPLPVSPAAPLSEAELVSDGVLTPTDSMSLAGSGEDIAEDVRSNRSVTEGRYYDVMSDDEGMVTPASWTEVGSVVSEADAAPAAPQPSHA